MTCSSIWQFCILCLLALALTHGQVAGLPACFYSGASLIRFHQPRRRHLPRTDKSYHFFPVFVSRIQSQANTRGINLLHLPLFIGNSDGILVFTFLDMACSILEEVSIFFFSFLISLHEYPMLAERLYSTGVHVSHTGSLVMCLDAHSSQGSSYKIFSCSTFSVSFTPVLGNKNISNKVTEGNEIHALYSVHLFYEYC